MFGIIQKTEIACASSPIERKVGQTAIKTEPFNLWCLKDMHIKPADFGKYSRHFKVDSSFTNMEFFAYPGDYNPRINGMNVNYTRVEAWDVNKYNPSDTWRNFEANYEINTKSKHRICYTQLKAHKGEKAIFMCHIKQDTLTYTYVKGEGNQMIAVLSPGQKFKIKLSSNGKQVKLWYNDSLITEGELKVQDANAEIYFRWGIYNNLVQDEFISVSVTDLRR